MLFESAFQASLALGLVNLISRCWEVVPISWLAQVWSK
jgi:hypothetical protein